MLQNDEIVPGTYDKVFKAVWQDPRNKNLLAFFLSEFIKLSQKEIYNRMVFTNTELSKENYLEKGMITDLLIGVPKILTNLEMNRKIDKGQIKKSNGYAHKLVVEITKTNGKYEIVLQVNLDATLNFDGELSTEYMMRSKDGKSCIDENYIIYHINMVKIVYKYYTNCRFTRFEKIIVMMCTRSIKVLEELAKGDDELMTFKKTLEEIGKDNGIIGLYNEDEMNEFAYQTNLKESHDEGIKIGVQIGFERGSRQGFEQGDKQGFEYNVPINVDTIRRRYPIKWTYQEGIKSLIVDTKIWVF